MKIVFYSVGPQGEEEQLEVKLASQTAVDLLMKTATTLEEMENAQETI